MISMPAFMGRSRSIRPPVGALLEYASNRVVVVDNTLLPAGYVVLSFRDVPPNGGPHYMIYNVGAAAFPVKNVDEELVISVPSGQALIVTRCPDGWRYDLRPWESD